MNTPFQTHGAFSWHELMARDADAVLPFYTTLFGWTIEAEAMPDGPYHVIKAAGDAVGGVMTMPPHLAQSGMPPAWGCYVTVNDVDATAAQAASLGGKVVHGPVDIPGVGRFAVIVDPQGAAVSVMTYKMPGG